MNLKILIIYSDIYCSCTRKGTFEFSKGLRNFAEANVLFYRDLREEHFKYYDVIIFQRLGGNGAAITSDYLYFVEKLIKKYKGKTLTYYSIDDLLENEIIIYFMRIVDRLLFPNEHFIKFFSKYNRNADFTGPYIDIETVESIKPRVLGIPNKLKILWGSTALVGVTFMYDLIPKILKDIPNVEIYILGKGDPFIPKSPNIFFMGILPFEGYISVAKSCDIHLNPISVDSEYIRNKKTEDFLNCKSPIKFLNAAILKKVFITSKGGYYSSFVKDYENGVILDNQSSLWIEVIKKVMDSKQIKENLIENAYNFVTENYSVTKASEKIIKIFEKQIFKPKEIAIDILDLPPITEKIPEIKINKIKDYLEDISTDTSGSNIGQLLPNRLVTQEFKLTQNNFCGFAIFVGTYMRNNNTHLTVELYIKNTSKNPLYSVRKSTREISDNTWMEFLFEPLRNSANTEFILKIYSLDARPNNAVTLYYNAFNSYGNFKINTSNFKGSLALKTFYKN